MHAIEAREQTTAFGAALLMHGALAIGLLLSVSWSQKPPPVVQVELWAAPPADRPSNPIAAPAPQTPAPKSPAVPPAPPPAAKADISTQKKSEPTKRQLEEAAEKAAQKKLAQERAQKQQEAIRKAELDRLLSQETKSRPSDRGKDTITKAGASQGAEIGAKTGVDPSFLQLVEARIKSKINFNPSTVPGNPVVNFEIEQLPSGEVVRVSKVKSSGALAWDAAVEKAIWAASPLPKPQNGPIPRIFDYSAGPNEIR